MRNTIQLLLAGLLLGASTFIDAAELEGRVVGISDGDTLTLLDAGNQQHRIRLAQIDAPEKSQAFGADSKTQLSNLAYGKRVRVEIVDTDRYGRTVGTVWTDGVNANKEMVRAGLAWVYRQYATDPDLFRIESEAKANGKGLWAEPSPTPPWEYRRKKRG